MDALDAKAVQAHLDDLVSKSNHLDISFNLINKKSIQNIPLVDMDLEDFVRPIDISMPTQFITNTVAGRIMITQGSGIILSLTATPGSIGYPNVGSFGPACTAMESLTRDLGAELGPHGVRVVTIR